MKASVVAALASVVLLGVFGTRTGSAPEAEAKEGKPPALVVGAALDLKWVEAPAGVPRGLKVALLSGDPARPGLVVMRVKIPANYRVPAHWHPADENVSVLSGTIYVGTGEKLDPLGGKPVQAGGFFTMPAQTDHFLYTTKTEAVIELAAIGPLGIMYVDPRDDPHKAAMAVRAATATIPAAGAPTGK